MPALYRAIKSSEIKEFNPHPNSRRAPGNIPYLVDNLWEWLRPKEFPCRRMAAFASPTHELALACACMATEQRQHYVVMAVTFPGRFKIAQAPQSDAKFHPDVKQLPKEILRFLGAEWTSMPARNRLDIAPLFLPAVSQEEVEETMLGIKGGNELREIIRTKCTFWQDAKLLTTVDSHSGHSEGEIFFEALDGYHLSPVRST